MQWKVCQGHKNCYHHCDCSLQSQFVTGNYSIISYRWSVCTQRIQFCSTNLATLSIHACERERRDSLSPSASPGTTDYIPNRYTDSINRYLHILTGGRAKAVPTGEACRSQRIHGRDKSGPYSWGCAVSRRTICREVRGAIFRRSAGRLSASSLPTVGSKQTKAESGRVGGSDHTCIFARA